MASYIIEAEDLDAALAWASKVTGLVKVPIEVRPFAEEGSQCIGGGTCLPGLIIRLNSACQRSTRSGPRVRRLGVGIVESSH